MNYRVNLFFLFFPGAVPVCVQPARVFSWRVDPDVITLHPEGTEALRHRQAAAGPGQSRGQQGERGDSQTDGGGRWVNVCFLHLYLCLSCRFAASSTHATRGLQTHLRTYSSCEVIVFCSETVWALWLKHYGLKGELCLEISSFHVLSCIFVWKENIMPFSG